MAYSIGKRWSFAAGHQLEDLPAGHKCSRPHGHTYTVEVTLTAQQLDHAGMVADFACLDPLGDYLAAQLDHTVLNDVLAIQPSCENLARHLFDWCRSNLDIGHLVTAVRVAESPDTWAAYSALPCVSDPAPPDSVAADERAATDLAPGSMS